VKRIRILMMLVAVALIAVSEPIRAIDLGSASSCVATNDAEIYCMMLGGCPLNGYCHFPDGKNYALWYLYNEQAKWEIEIYGFLNSVDCYPSIPLNLSFANTTANQTSMQPYSAAGCPYCQGKT